MVGFSTCPMPAAAEPQAAATPFAPILKYAAFASASYGNLDAFKGICRTYEFEFVHSGAHLTDKVRYFIATNAHDKSQIIAVRGTSNIDNAVVDIDYVLTPDKLAGIDLHKGFAQSAQNIFQELKSRLRKDHTVHITGHSLGGAVAVILGMYLDNEDYTLGDIVTFGQPKVTNRSGAQRFGHLNVLRVNTVADMVSLVPPFDASQILNFKFDVFWHLGKEYLLLSDKYYSVLDGMDSLLRGTDFLIKTPAEENITAHRMATYLSLLERLANTSILIPFEEKDKYLPPPQPAPVSDPRLKKT